MQNIVNPNLKARIEEIEARNKIEEKKILHKIRYLRQTYIKRVGSMPN